LFPLYRNMPHYIYIYTDNSFDNLICIGILIRNTVYIYNVQILPINLGSIYIYR